MAANTTDLAGIPIPSTDPSFLVIVAIHIAFGIAAVIAGAAAMLSRKGSHRHVRFGSVYFWSLSGIFVTMGVLSALRAAQDWHLFVLGSLSFGAALLGRSFIRRRRPRLHLAGMGASYVIMLTAFYVDNGKNLPLWRDLPSISYWIIPGAIGIPLIAYFTWRLPRLEWPTRLHGTSKRS